MDIRHFVDRVSERAPFEDRAHAMAAVEATLAALGHLLFSNEVQRMKDDLGPSLGRLLTCDKPDCPVANDLRHDPATRGFAAVTIDDFYRMVARHEWASVSTAIEHAQIVCRELAPLLSESVIRRLGKRIVDLRALFDLASEVSLTGSVEHRGGPTRRQTLAEARPGSRHPLSEARPASGQTHSIAASDDPHRDTKLSSADGLTQEREHETLATGRPGSSRPLSG